MQPNCFLATLDLKEAYYLVPVAESCRKFLRFKFENLVFEFTCLPFGLSTAPYVFTKIMRPIVTLLRKRGLLSVIYIDDFLLFGNTKRECEKNIAETTQLLTQLGFIINKEKSSLIPAHRQKYLGFILDSAEMLIKIPDDKRVKIQSSLTKFKINTKHKIRDFASLVGTLGSVCQATKYGWVYMKSLEREKFLALQKTNGNYEARLVLSNHVHEDIEWWSQNIMPVCNPIRSQTYALEIFSDASLSGWGACCGKEKAYGFWNLSERKNPINILELKAAFFGLKCFGRNRTNCDILLRIDNTTAISYINRMGGIQFQSLSKVAKTIWQWCEHRNITIFASYIPSSKNKTADHESRRLEPETEFSLSQEAFSDICKKFSKPEIDLFASRVNAKCKKYVSWKKDPSSFTIDAFTLDWGKYFFFAFPPFAIIPKVLKKIQNDRARGIIVIPNWPSQAWFPKCMKMFDSSPIIFEPNKKLLSSSNREHHPLWNQLSLVGGILSYKPSL
ncbi:uncharacterized protein LOC122504134 [Leptopilina heterotoma]|uniref:uncharacterized protein LOC122504134 n=1 Tax=Leptopilina heterotoma TaxID=63436 RepID=UPI001CA91D0A|nr:uncharacterized protein LOC122504134 [Leptopilina heterotoma]